MAGGGGGAEKKAKDDEAAAKRYIESLDKQREKVKELSEVEVALAEIQRIRAQGGEVTEAQKQRILQFAAEIDITKERTAAEKEAAHERDENQRRTLALNEEGKKLYEATLTPLEAYNAAVEHLNELREKGVITTQTYVRTLPNWSRSSMRRELLAGRPRAACDALLRYLPAYCRSIRSPRSHGCEKSRAT